MIYIRLNQLKIQDIHIKNVKEVSTIKFFLNHPSN